jgi:GntR family transcriptional regulator
MRTELRSGLCRIGVIKNFILYVPQDNWDSAISPDIKMAMAVPTVESSLLRRKLNRSSGVPLHLQIERMLRKLITSPPYSSGALLPDELTLAEKLGVSRGTVRNSILNLVNQGLLVRRKGVGTRVVQSGLVAWASLTGEMRRKGIEIQSFLLEVSEKRANAKVAAALKVPEGTIVKCLEQVRGWDARPVLQSVSWFHPRLKLTGSEDFRRPLYELLKQETGITPVHAVEEFRAIAANAVLARRLRINKGGPLLLRVRTTVDANELPIDYAEIHYQTGVISLTLDSRWRPVDQA